MKAKTKVSRLFVILLALVMVVGMLPTTALAEEPDAFLQFADAPGDFFYRNDGGYDSEGPTVDTIFTLTEPTMITGIWTYHWYAANYDIDFSRQTIQLKNTTTNTVVYSGAVRVGHHVNTRDCDWIVLPNIVLPAGTYQVIDSHNESWCALNSKGVCMVKGYSSTPSATADFSTDPTAALSLLNAAKTGTTDSTWDSSNNTLTLNGVNFTTTASTAVKLPAGSEIVLNGDNIITSGEAKSKDSFGIYALGDLTIKGAGKLTVTSDTANDDSHGIYAEDSIAISGNVTATSGTANDDCYGIHAGDSIAISGTAKVTATGGTATDDSHGIYAKGSIAISGGTVTANGGKATDESYGIYTKGNITITDGTVTANGGTATDDSYGIYTKGNITITDGTVTANGGEAGDSYGIYASGRDEDYIGVKISGGATVTATGGEATNGDSYGINAYHKVNIAGGTVNANGGTATNHSFGIYADDDVNIAGGTVNANGGTATNHSFGIYADDDVNIAGGTVNANGGTATNNSYGIYAHYKVNIAGGTVTAQAGTAMSSHAFNKSPSISISPNYWWRTSDSGQYKKGDFNWGDVSTYVEIGDTEPITTYTVTFDANGGTGTMADVTDALGDYTLPANGFTAPEGKQFKCWSVDGNEKAVGDKITVSANTTVKAVWEDIEYTVTVTNGTASPNQAAAGATVTLTANRAPSGQVFDKWVVESGSITLADASSATTTFTMPAGAVRVKATYKDAPHTHTFDQEIVKDAALKTAADCTHDAVYYKSCSCGAINTNDADTFTAIGSALGHNYTKKLENNIYLKTAASNCTEYNVYWYACSRCDANAKDDAAATDKYYTGTTAGNHSFTEKIEDAAHYMAGTGTDCQSVKKYYYDCAYCDQIGTTTWDSTTYGEHNYAATWSSDADGHWHECSLCHGKKDNAAHTPGAAATETTPQKCTECDYIITPALGHTHSYSTDWKTDTDKHWHECSCGDKSEEAAHTAGDWIIDTPATTTTDGTKHKECTVCHRVLETGTIPATGHSVSFNANGGSGTMADVTGVSGTYTLPENGFTAPEGKQFKAWSVNGTEKAVGATINVTANTTVTAVWETIPATSTEYDILDGANSSWTQNSDGSLSIRGSGAFSEFVGVKVDRTLVDAKYYTVKEGSTIVTLKADYLNTCTVGSHTLEIVWTDGSASTTFSVNAKSPQTGDNSMMWIWIALLFVSGIGVMGTTIYIRKKKYSGK